MTDPRIDTLGNSAILTDTQMRLVFAPHDPDARVIALGKGISAFTVANLSASMPLGKVHFQVKAGFAAERSVKLTVAELFLLIELADRFVTGLPGAQRAKPLPE